MGLKGTDAEPMIPSIFTRTITEPAPLGQVDVMVPVEPIPKLPFVETFEVRCQAPLFTE